MEEDSKYWLKGKKVTVYFVGKEGTIGNLLLKNVK